jgi:hypothetical protein
MVELRNGSGKLVVTGMVYLLLGKHERSELLPEKKVLFG